MATTHTPQNAMDYAKRFIGNSPLDDTEIKLRVLDDASDMLHLHAPWYWSVGAYADITVVNGTSDYAVADPGDVLHLIKAQIISSDSRVETLAISNSIPDAPEYSGTPREIARVDSTTLRISPTPQMGSGTFTLRVWYKRENTDITAGNVSTAATLLFPDEWFHVYQEIVMLKAFTFTSDTRMGNVTVQSNGAAQYSGQWGVVMAALNNMRVKNEPFLMELGQESPRA